MKQKNKTQIQVMKKQVNKYWKQIQRSLIRTLASCKATHLSVWKINIKCNLIINKNMI